MRIVPVICLMGLLSAGAALAADAAAAPRPMKIGHVDLTRALDKYHHRQTLEAELKEFQSMLVRQDEVNRKERAKLDAEIDQLAMGSPDRLALEKRRKGQTAEVEAGARDSHEKLNKRYVEMMMTLYTEISKEVEAVAREGDYDLILKDQSIEPDISLRGEVILQMSQRVVLFSKPEYDLTDQVLKRLNEKYDAEQKKAETAKDANPVAAPPAQENKP